jgi:glycosyltransferase involved in cell wall biosynthesis
VFEYANRLSARGHDVTVVLPAPDLLCGNSSLLKKPRMLVGSAVDWKAQGEVPWFNLAPAVKRIVLWGPRRQPNRLPASDCTIATAWQTAPFVAAARPAAGRKFYLIQHYEVWNSAGSAEDVDATWSLPMKKIVISKWLQELALSKGDPHSVYIPNGLDFDELGLDIPISERGRPFTVGMLAHPSSWKGTQIGLSAIEAARSAIPDLRAVLYGAQPRPAGLPRWIEYREGIRGAELRSYFNSLTLFLHTSLTEGWPLPPAEAMACGAALVAADNPGVLDYASAGTAVVVRRHDAAGTAEAIRELALDPARRQRIATAGLAAIQKYSWPTAVESLERVLKEATLVPHVGVAATATG